MSLSPEERRKIYEEEKARIEAREHIEREKRDSAAETSTGLNPNLASLLCYVGAWVSGIIFFILEQKNATVRFHAAQSIIVFGSLTIAGSILGLIPFGGHVFSTLIGIAAFILWIICIVKVSGGQELRLGIAADIAEKMAASSPYSNGTVHGTPKSGSETEAAFVSEPEPEASAAPSAGPASQPHQATAVPPINLDREIGRKIEEYFTRKKTGRIASSAFTIAFSVAVLIFFNYFNEYVAYYSSDIVNGVKVWTVIPFFTHDIHLWLPVLNTALSVSIIGHVLAIIFDRYVLREILMIIIEVFSLWSAITLVSIFPFDFTIIPDASVADLVDISVRIALIVACAGIGIGILVRSIKFLVNLAQGHTSYEVSER